MPGKRASLKKLTIISLEKHFNNNLRLFHFIFLNTFILMILFLPPPPQKCSEFDDCSPWMVLKFCKMEFWSVQGCAGPSLCSEEGTRWVGGLGRVIKVFICDLCLWLIASVLQECEAVSPWQPHSTSCSPLAAGSPRARPHIRSFQGTCGLARSLSER